MSPALAEAFAAGLATIALLLAAFRRSGSPVATFRHFDTAALRDAGWQMTIWKWELIRSVVVLGVLGFALSTGLPVVLVALVAVTPSVIVRMRATAARRRARRWLTRIAAGIEAALRSGSSLPDALRREAGSCQEPIAREALQRAIRAFDLGDGLDVALRAAADELHDRRSALLLGTLAIGLEERLGTPRLIELISSVTERLAFEQRLEDEVRARASGVRQQQWLLAVLVPAIAFLLISSMPGLSSELNTPVGRYVLVPGAILLEISGIVLTARFVDEALG